MTDAFSRSGRLPNEEVIAVDVAVLLEVGCQRLNLKGVDVNAAVGDACE
jgi:hypothetical protein